MQLRHDFPAIRQILFLNYTTPNIGPLRFDDTRQVWFENGIRATGNYVKFRLRGILSKSSFGTSSDSYALFKRCLGALFVVVMTLGAASGPHAAPDDERRLAFHNIHTNEDIDIVYKRKGVFVPEALKKLDHFMRDWRRNVTIKIDPALYDLIWKMHRDLGSKVPIKLICGHRTVSTNRRLRRRRGGQARRSLHITGKAADIQFPDIPIKQLRNAGLILERGGVGYYPRSGVPFVHVDTGRVRHWPRMGRQQLAVLFPSGRSKHVPADGKSLTKRDFRVALARLEARGGELPYFLKRKKGRGARTVLASLDTGKKKRTAAKPKASPPAAAPSKPKLTLASLSPSLGSPSGKETKRRAEVKPALLKPATVEADKTMVQGRTELTSARPDERLTVDEILGNDAVAAPGAVRQKIELDADEIADDEEYQIYPVLPYMSDTPVASMDMTGGAVDLALPKVHLLLGETRWMLQEEFRPGLQVAEFHWARQFRGTAVNTRLRRLARRAPETGAVKTAASKR